MVAVIERDIEHLLDLVEPYDIPYREGTVIVLIGVVEALYLQEILKLVTQRSRRVFKAPVHHYAKLICKEVSDQMRSHGWPVSGCTRV